MLESTEFIYFNNFHTSIISGLLFKGLLVAEEGLEPPTPGL